LACCKMTTAVQMETDSPKAHNLSTVVVAPHYEVDILEDDRLSVVVHLPQLKSIDNLEVHLEQNKLELYAPYSPHEVYELNLTLPKAIHIEEGSYKFKKARSQLRMLLPMMTAEQVALSPVRGASEEIPRSTMVSPKKLPFGHMSHDREEHSEGDSNSPELPSAQMADPSPPPNKWGRSTSSPALGQHSKPPATPAQLLHEMQTFDFGWDKFQVAVAPPVVGTPNNVGACVWVCSLALAVHIAEDPEMRELIIDRDVLELGCGCGIVGFVAAGVGSKYVWLSDSETDVLANLRHSLAANKHRAKIEVVRLAWEDECEHPASGCSHPSTDSVAWENKRFEVILGSDLLYTMDRIHLVLGALQSRLEPGGVCLLGNAMRDMRMNDAFAAQMVAAGFSLERTRIHLPRDVVEAQDDVGLLAEWQLYKGSFELMIIRRDTS